MDEAEVREQVAGMRFAADLRQQFEMLADAAPAAPRSRILRRSRWLALAAVLGAAAILAFAVLPALRGTETATAADMLAAMEGAPGVQTVHLRLMSLSRYGGEGDKDAPDYREWMKEELTLSVTGDYRGESRGTDPANGIVRSEFGYDATRRELRVASPNHGDGLEVLHPAWPTDSADSGDSAYLLYAATASSVRALLAEVNPDTQVEETTYLGRPAWRATLPSAWKGGPGLVVTVDKATGLLLETRRSGVVEGNRYLDVMRVTLFETDPPLDAGWQVLPLLTEPTADLKWNYFRNDGTRFGSLDAVAERAWPTLPLVPEALPGGYSRVAVANAVYEDPRPGHQDDNSWHWGVKVVKRPGQEPGLAYSRRLALRRCAQGVLVLYRRGFQSFTVQISPRLPGEPGLHGLEEEGRVTAQDTVLTGGALKGARARTWIASAMLPVARLNGDSIYVKSEGPTLLTYSDRSQVVIYGDLTRQELIDVANSLRVYGDVGRPLPEGYGQ